MDEPTITLPKREKRPAKIINEYIDEQGQTIREYDNGMAYNLTAKRISRAPAPEFRGIRSSEEASMIRRLAVQQTREALQEAILRKTRESGFNYTNTPPEAVAHVGGMLWELAMSDETKPRDRREIWESIGRQSGLLADNRRNNDDDGPDAPQTLDVNALRAVVAQLREAKQLLDGAKRPESTE